MKEDSAGKLEAGIHSELLLFQTSGYYFDGDHKQSCFELFACDLETGINAFKKYGNEEDLRLHVDLDKYEFRPIASDRRPRSESPRNSLDRHKSNEPVFQEEIMAELDPALHSPRDESLRDGDELKAPIKEKQLYISSNDVPPSHKTDTDHGQNKRRVPFAVLMVAAVIVGAGFVWVAIS